MKYFDMFSGVGGFTLGIQQAYDIRFNIRNRVEVLQQDLSDVEEQQNRATCVGFSEIDKYASQLLQIKWPTIKNYGDATKIDEHELPDFDLLVGGFPCQSFSVAGKRKGFDDTRGTLFFDIARILEHKKPSHLVLENVKGLLSHDGGRTFQTIIRVLTDLGYFVEWQVLNSKNFGVPQNRERVFIVGHLGGEPRPKVFPIGEANEKDIKQLNKPTHSNDRVYSDQGISPTLNTMQGGSRQPFVAMRWNRTEKGKQARRESQKLGKDYTPFNEGHRELVPAKDEIIGTITSQAIAKDSLLGSESRVRRLTPLECERLQGFPDDFYEGIEMSDTQKYKQMGNAVTTTVVQHIVERLLYNSSI